MNKMFAGFAMEPKDWLLLGIGALVSYLASFIVGKQTEKKKSLCLR
jgi:hypothetical protein